MSLKTELDKNQIEKIRALFLDGIPRQDLAKRFGVSIGRIRTIVKGLPISSRKDQSLDLSRLKIQKVPAIGNW